MARRIDEEKHHMDASVGNVALAHSGELFAQVNTVLILDVLDNRFPTVLVVDQIAVAGSVNQVKL